MPFVPVCAAALDCDDIRENIIDTRFYIQYMCSSAFSRALVV